MFLFYIFSVFRTLENIISVFQASFTALEIANCHVIWIKTSIMSCSIEYSQYFDEFPYWLAYLLLLVAASFSLVIL